MNENEVVEAEAEPKRETLKLSAKSRKVDKVAESAGQATEAVKRYGKAVDGAAEASTNLRAAIRKHTAEFHDSRDESAPEQFYRVQLDRKATKSDKIARAFADIHRMREEIIHINRETAGRIRMEGIHHLIARVL